MKNTNRKIVYALMGMGLLVFLVGCGSNAVPTGTGMGNGAMTVRLVDAPVTGYKEININVQEVRICQGNSEWITLGKPDKTVNLLELTGGVSKTIVDNATLPAGHYDQMRLLLGPGNTVKLADDSVHDLKIPSGLQSGLKLIVSFDVEVGTTKDVFIDFDAAHSIMLHQAGHKDKYILRPTVRAFDKVMTGSVTGKLTNNATGDGLARAIVTAQTLDASGNASIVRSVLAGDDGSYVLDLLPVGATYYIVSQPVVGTAVYDAQLSDPINLTSETPISIWSATFVVSPKTGELIGAITPVAGENDGDTIDLLQALTVGSTTHSLIVRTTTGVVTDPTETYSLTPVPAGDYTVKGIRTTIESDGSATIKESLTTPTVTVPASGSVTADLQF